MATWIPTFVGMTGFEAGALCLRRNGSALFACHPDEGRDPSFINSINSSRVSISKQLSKQYYVYIIANKLYGTLYVGVTSALIQRIHQHKEGVVEGFSKAHGLDRLVWYEVHEDVHAAITREKQIKEWKRAWKVNLIQTMNPEWRDLYLEIV